MENSIREQLNEVRALIQEKQTQSPQTTLSPSLSRIELQAQTEYVFLIFVIFDFSPSHEQKL